MSRLLEGLNPSQRDAVMHVDGPLLVLAGPGSGKTRVITHRIAYMIEEAGIDPSSILALTFTNKAADEMRRRVEQLVPGRRIFAGTFHRLCARLLRKYASLVGLDSGFSILEPSDLQSLVKSIMREMDLDPVHIPPDSVQRRISALKNDLVSPEDFAQQAVDYFDRTVVNIYPRVQEALRAQNAVDFDDLLGHVATILRTNPDLRARLDETYRYVLVDEYQDTNLAQYAIARGLSVDYPNLCATGDPDQSIYSWRGANISNILNFEEDFPGARVVRLEQNYRSTGNILAVADYLIRHNVNRKEKSLTTDNEAGPLVQVVCHKDDTSESRHVAHVIRSCVDEGVRDFRDFAVFVRTSGLTRSFEQAFRALNVPYQVIGGYSFFERREIRDLLAYVRVLVNPRDVSAFERIVKTPPKGIGGTTLERLANYASRKGMPIGDACREADHVAGLKKKQITALRDLRMLLDEMAEAVKLPPQQGLSRIVELTDYRKYAEESTSGDPDESTHGVVDELLASAQTFQFDNPEASLLDFVESISLSGATDERDDAQDVVTLMTLHAAKGLEFPVVFLVAFEDKILPHERAVQERGEEEERRLVFVGITRAREELLISYVRSRQFQGTRRFSSPSPFLLELPNDSIARHDVVAAAGYREPPEYDDYANQESGYEEPSIPVYRSSRDPSPSDRYHKGMWVRHHEYGDGMILQIEGEGSSRKATVHFPTAGTKRFVLEKASLQPMS